MSEIPDLAEGIVVHVRSVASVDGMVTWVVRAYIDGQLLATSFPRAEVVAVEAVRVMKSALASRMSVDAVETAIDVADLQNWQPERAKQKVGQIAAVAGFFMRLIRAFFI
jgi:hypothetical protein